MKVLNLFLLACLTCAWGQTPQATTARAQTPPTAPTKTFPKLEDDEVVCKFSDGTVLTMKQFRNLYMALPQQMQQMALDTPQQFLDQVSLLHGLTKMAEEGKLDQESPIKEALEFGRMYTLGQAELQEINKQAIVGPEEVTNFYKANEDRYRQVKVKAIFVSYEKAGGTDPKGKKILTQEQAKAKAAKLVEQIRKGADFVKLAKENSDDETSREKDGDFVTLGYRENVPDAVRKAIFALKKGEVSDPVEQPSGYYIFRAEEITVRPLDDTLKREIYTEIQSQHYREKMDALVQKMKAKDINPKFLK